ncbi:peptide chain release factor N(5)-glutamine methyltransferase [Aestuariibius sp. 2305UL40-4]|uniref:peptide chain release factor N(5)-glutamine methyltransferase n=1 Tax=Aestuariibius violaceus TaxID=3234132 RepID=UPI00345E792F
MTGTRAVAQAARRLKAAGVEDAVRDARRLFAAATGIAADRVTLVLPESMTPAAEEAFEALVAKRCKRIPVSHLTGRRAFYGRDFTVTDAVLDPRPETEILVAAALERPFRRVLDLGVGSGCILLTLLAERPEATGLGVDTSGDALSVAAENRARLELRERAELRQGDWYAGIEGPFDLIVSNPPYIAEAEMADLAPELRHEPRVALTDGGDGLSAYRIIVPGAMDRLAPGGRLMVEVGAAQGPEVSALFRAAGFADIAIPPDLDGRDRVVSGRKPAEKPL